ncbi:MAG: UDP-glucose 4-epimerase GalE [Deltaproteobacteria bacterium]|nr:UDP-glucose 4-epimerase GalE [Deltaproteobacteria bacterium]
MNHNRILVVGGAGYVGSHFALCAHNTGFHVTVMDNLSKGHRAALRCTEFYQGDLADSDSFREHLSRNSYDGIFHFAASCLVGESVSDPAQYYQNNVIAAFNMLEAMRFTGHRNVVFSSTCAVYGVPQRLPLREDHPKNPISPYGRTKLIIEWMLEDYHQAYGIRSACLRYFNAAGCEPDYWLGEDHRPETHLIPNVVRYALGLDKDFVIYGGDYPTSDGTCIRDYIHVTDLAKAHLKALALLDNVPLLKLNLGTGAGFSNLQVVQAVSRVSGIDLKAVFGPRRPGDPPELVADSTEASRLLDWSPSRSNLDAIVSEVLRWVSEHPQGYPE